MYQTPSAQVDRATLTGIVKDPSDAVIPGAQVTVTSLATGVVTKVTTNDEGTYLVLNLMPGEYLVQVEAAGLPAVRADRRARDRHPRAPRHLAGGRDDGRDGHRRRRHAAAQHRVGSRSARSSPTTKCRSCRWRSATGTTCSPMVPGVQSDRYTEQAGGTSAGRTGGVSVHGNRSLQNNFLLDGVANNSFSTNVQELTTQISRPSVDAIQEFKVVTSPYAAEYGWAPGAAIIVNTKSGTNAIRGTAYEFFRNDGLDTINYFAKAANQPKADQQSEPVRRQSRRPDRAQQAVLLRRLRGHAHRAGRAAHRPRADAGRAERCVHHARSGIR